MEVLVGFNSNWGVLKFFVNGRRFYYMSKACTNSIIVNGAQKKTHKVRNNDMILGGKTK
jgi:hypothetical protein